MNIFLPYEKDTRKSVGALDDKRLLKQILEVRQILKVADGESEGYKNHPITKHYIQYKNFLIVYGYDCCLEYNFRFHRHHKYSDYFKERYRNETNYGKDVFWIPFYAEGAKDSFNCIRTTEHDCVSLKMSEWEAVDYPCSKLMFMTERNREKNGKN